VRRGPPPARGPCGRRSAARPGPAAPSCAHRHRGRPGLGPGPRRHPRAAARPRPPGASSAQSAPLATEPRPWHNRAWHPVTQGPRARFPESPVHLQLHPAVRNRVSVICTFPRLSERPTLPVHPGVTAIPPKVQGHPFNKGTDCHQDPSFPFQTAESSLKALWS
jgi:hypothetical protein